MKNFVEDMGINGHLTIVRRWNTGQEEVIFDDHNVIVSGMGVGLSHLFAGSGSNSILDYQIDRFQVGVSGPPAGGETSAIYELSGPLTTVEEYGTGSKVYVEIGHQMTNTTLTTNQAFVKIPQNKWYFNPYWLIVGFLFVGPFVLLLVWLNPGFDRRKKIGISIAILIFSSFWGILFVNALKSIAGYYQQIYQLLE